MSEKTLVIGHPLCAEENRIPFLQAHPHDYQLVLPQRWKARSLHTVYDTPPGSGPQINVCEVYFSGYNSLFFYRNLTGLLNKISPDIIYCWEEPWCLASFQIIRYAKKMKIPFIFYSAENKPKKLPLPFRWVQKIVYKFSYAAIVITEKSKERLVQSGYQKPIHIIPLWVRSYPEIETTPQGKSLVYIGRLIPLKGLRQLISALVLLPEFSLTLIGDGPDASHLKALADKHKLDSRVFFKGKIDNDKLLDYIKKSSLAVFPTLENEKQAEQFGKAALECLCMQVPVLASRTGEYTEMSKYFNTMVSFDLTTPEKIALAVQQIFENYPSQSQRLQARKQVMETYSSDAVARQFNLLFQSIRSESQTPRHE